MSKYGLKKKLKWSLARGCRTFKGLMRGVPVLSQKEKVPSPPVSLTERSFKNKTEFMEQLVESSSKLTVTDGLEKKTRIEVPLK